MVYLNGNLWSTYIQPHLEEQNEDEMIYLGKAADMDIIYYGKFDVENFYEKNTGDIRRNDSDLEEVTSENKMEKTRRLFCEFFPFFV